VALFLSTTFLLKILPFYSIVMLFHSKNAANVTQQELQNFVLCTTSHDYTHEPILVRKSFGVQNLSCYRLCFRKFTGLLKRIRINTNLFLVQIAWMENFLDWIDALQFWLILIRFNSQVSASTSSREPVIFQYIPAGPSEESVRQNSGHHLPSKMENGTPNSYMVL